MANDRARLDAHLPLRPVEFHILLSLSTGERHGYGIIQDIEARGEAAPDVGTMYRALARLVEHTLIEGVPSRESADERRINYCITALGTRVARAEARRLEALARVARVSGLLTRKAT